MNEILNIGIIGGGIGKSHIEAYQSLPGMFKVQAFCDIDPAKASEISEKYEIPLSFTDIQDLFKREDIDIIDVCTPSYLHYPQAKDALSAGKHVILEKPVCGSLEEIDSLIKAESTSGKRLMPIFQYRFGHGLQKLKYLVDNGIAGKAYLTTVETAWRRRSEYYAVPWRGKWKTELGGPLVTLAIHAHDAIYYILGPAKRVFARTTTRVNPIETEDCVSASLEMADGSLCSLSITTGSSQEISRHRFCFSALTAESNTQPYNNTTDPWIFVGDTPENDAAIQNSLAEFQDLPEGYVGQFWRYYHAIKNDSEFPVTLSQARASLELITALYLSADTNQPVELPITPGNPYYTGWQPRER